MRKTMSLEDYMNIMPDYQTDTQRCLDWMFGGGEFAQIDLVPPTNKKTDKLETDENSI